MSRHPRSRQRQTAQPPSGRAAGAVARGSAGHAQRARPGRHRRRDERPEPLVEVRAHREAAADPWWQRIPRPSPAALAGLAVLVLIAVGAVHLTSRGSAVATAGADPVASAPAGARSTSDSAPSAADRPPTGAEHESEGGAPPVPQGSAEDARADKGGRGAAVAEAQETAVGTDESSTVVVYVSGAVKEPGVVELPAGARVADAIEDAGGRTAKADLTSVNLARVLVDAEQVHVPTEGEAPAAAAGAGGPAAGSEEGDTAAPDPISAGPGAEEGPSAGAAVDINTADATGLQELPGVGPAIAERIVEHREQNGPFASVDDLTEVSGIGPATLEKIRPRATV
ncbi:competence protein ComEA [Brachybacterium endophyticum]|uniref:Competence protein ComEA n=1 Tax=Brachybacterium endophyticum TaxID=2182385 RepID=A0A2U2RI55_9MICO|nr:ComEA family DNA-binding protein [Brachybacterium endophyticum]PWH05536.1 competence protein ComEA [Brachybacterium endophyticum]